MPAGRPTGPGRWESDPTGALTTDERKELAQLRRDKKRLEQENAFLKKASAFFAKESL